jgi:hypothetical protein
MMKYVVNHDKEFNLPKTAWTVGLLQFLGGTLTEFISIIFISSLAKPIDVIIKFVALGAIAKVDDWYGGALPHENKVKQNFGKAAPTFTNHRRGFLEEDKRTYGIKFLAFCTKIIRIIYCSWIFYFLPFLVLLIPYVIPPKSTE